MRVDDMRFQFHGGMSPAELYETLAGATFEEEHHEAAPWHGWVGVEEMGWRENTNSHEP